jgi:hypothetical protein
MTSAAKDKFASRNRKTEAFQRIRNVLQNHYQKELIRFIQYRDGEEKVTC